MQGEDPQFKSLAYRVLKEWMTFEYVNIRLRALRMNRIIHWKTNEVPVPGWTTMMGDESELNEDLTAAVPYLNKLAMHLSTRDSEVSYEEFGLYLLALWMHERGLPGGSSLCNMMTARIGSRFDKLELSLKSERRDSP